MANEYSSPNPEKIRHPIAEIGSVDVATLTGTTTILPRNGRRHIYDPGGASRTVVMPASTADNVGLERTIYNTGDNGELLSVVQSDGTTAIESVPPGGSLTLVSGGTLWRIAGRSGAGLVYVNVAASAAITGATETETLFDKQYSIPANRLKAGSVVRVRAQGIHTATTGAETHSMILKIGSVAVVTLAAIDPANDDIFYFDATIVVRTIGASGTIVATGVCLSAAASAVGTAKPFALASTTLDTTAAAIVGVAIDRQGTATDSDSARLDILTVEVIG